MHIPIKLKAIKILSLEILLLIEIKVQQITQRWLVNHWSPSQMHKTKLKVTICAVYFKFCFSLPCIFDRQVKTERSKISQSTIHHGTLHLQLLGWWVWFISWCVTFHIPLKSMAVIQCCSVSWLNSGHVICRTCQLLKIFMWNWMPQLPKGGNTTALVNIQNTKCD